ncbi:MAG: heavy-metal-associated domain-containing protein [Acidobacteria bacterium]|nr:heavy-metal-associated domain-containing protein [Acidobacteriota bacterium]
MLSVTIQIDGMHCNACVARVTRALAKVESARVLQVEVGQATVEIADPTAAVEAIVKAGYQARAK